MEHATRTHEASDTFGVSQQEIEEENQCNITEDDLYAWFMLSRHDEHYKTSVKIRAFRCLAVLAFHCFLRIQEALNIKLRHINTPLYQSDFYNVTLDFRKTNQGVGIEFNAILI